MFERLSCVLFVALCACRAPNGAPDRITLVSSLPRTGSANAQTQSIVNGIRLALEEANWRAGRFQLHFEDWDDASAKKGDWDPEVEAANADRAAMDPDVMLYLGTYNSGAAKISMPMLNRVGLAMISPANTYTGLTKPDVGEPNEPYIYRPSGKVNYFRVVPTDDLQGTVAARWIKDLGGKSVYILDDRGLYGKGIADVFAIAADDLGLKILGREGIDPKAQEYRSTMTKLRQLNPDWVYFAGITQSNAGQVAKDMVAVGLEAKLMVPDGCFEEAFIQAAGPEVLEGRTYVTFGGVPPDQLTGEGARFLVQYQARFRSMPEAYAVYGYVAARVGIAAIARANQKDREAIREALLETEEREGALGSWRFDENGDTTLSVLSGNEIRGGAFVFSRLLTTGEALETHTSTLAAPGGSP